MGEQTIVPEVLLDRAIELGLSFSDSAFPIGIFPSEIRNIIAEVHECQGFPIDYIASVMLVAIAVGILLPEIIPFAEDAKARLYVWQEEHAKLCDTESNETLVGVYCKLEVYVIRFCLIIQIARWVCLGR